MTCDEARIENFVFYFLLRADEKNFFFSITSNPTKKTWFLVVLEFENGFYLLIKFLFFPSPTFFFYFHAFTFIIIKEGLNVERGKCVFFHHHRGCTREKHGAGYGVHRRRAIADEEVMENGRKALSCPK